VDDPDFAARCRLCSPRFSGPVRPHIVRGGSALKISLVGIVVRVTKGMIVACGYVGYVGRLGTDLLRGDRDLRIAVGWI
jgi:hypothetical protein